MASDRAVAKVLAFLHELYTTREIGEGTLEAFSLAFADWTDEELKACALKTAREPGRRFFPTPGEIAAHRVVPVVDVDRVLDRIADLGTYTPASGWRPPRIEKIREVLGDGIMYAYVAAGTTDCFAPEARDGTTVTRDIARRALAKELAALQRLEPRRPLLPPAKDSAAITGGAPR